MQAVAVVLVVLAQSLQTLPKSILSQRASNLAPPPPRTHNHAQSNAHACARGGGGAYFEAKNYWSSHQGCCHIESVFVTAWRHLLENSKKALSLELNLPSCYSITSDHEHWTLKCRFLSLILVAVRLATILNFIIVVSGNIMGIIGGICGNNGVIQRALWNRIIGRFWSTLASPLLGRGLETKTRLMFKPAKQ